MKKRSMSLAVSLGAMALSAGVVWAAGGSINVQGTVNTHGNPPGTVDGGVTATAGQNGTAGAPLDTITPFEYHAPTAWNQTVAGPMATTIAGPGAGNTTTIKYQATSLTNPTINISGGGTVYIHITGNITIDGGTFTVSGNTRVVFFVDGKLTFNYTDLKQTGTGSSLQIQAQGDVVVKATEIQGVAFANQTLTLDGMGASMAKIKMDESRLGAAQEGLKYIRVLPILDGER